MKKSPNAKTSVLPNEGIWFNTNFLDLNITREMPNFLSSMTNVVKL